jgi:lipocalin
MLDARWHSFLSLRFSSYRAATVIAEQDDISPEQANQRIDQLQAEIQQRADQAVETATEAASATSRAASSAAIWAFVTLVLGASAPALGGAMGRRNRFEHAYRLIIGAAELSLKVMWRWGRADSETPRGVHLRNLFFRRCTFLLGILRCLPYRLLFPVARAAAPITRRFVALLMATLVAGCAPSGALPGAGPLESVDTLDLDRYLGTWYEIAKYPNRFEKGLVAVKAQYSQREDGTIRVRNSGRESTFDGERDSAEGSLWVPHAEAPAKLRVSFFWPFSADYWVIALDPDYRWAVVGEPDRRYLWILSRTPSLPQATYTAIVQQIRELGYDPTRLEAMPQPRP